MTSINDLKGMGAFVPDTYEKKEIEFVIDGESYKATVHVRRLSIGTHESIFLTAEPDKVSRTAKLLSEAIRLGEEGAERLSYQDAYKLHPSIAKAMTKAVNDVNGGDRKN